MISSTTTGPIDDTMDSTGDAFDDTVSEIIEIIIKDFSELLDKVPDYYSPLEDSIIRKRDAIAPQKKSLEINVPIYCIPLGSRAPPPPPHILTDSRAPFAHDQKRAFDRGARFAIYSPLTGII